MRPEAMGLALVLHAVAALALWWLAEHAPTITPREDPIEVTIERAPPKPPEPPPPPQAQPKPLPPPPPVEGIKPPAEKEADKATSVRPSGEAPKDVAAPPPDSPEKAAPEPPKPEPPSQTAMVAPNAPSPVPPPDRPMLQPLPKPEAGPTIEPPPPRPSPPVQKPPPVVAHPQPQRPAPPPPSPGLRQQPAPSPLVAPQRPSEPPAVARHQDRPTPPSSPFVNPAAEHARATAEQNYLWQVVSKLRGYRYHADVPVREGLTVVMVTIARDGRLLDAEVVRSSGVAAMDQGVLAGIRQGAPYAPLPASLSGPSARFRLPLVSVPDQR